MKKILYIIIPVLVLIILIAWLKRNKEIAVKQEYRIDKEQPVLVEADTTVLQNISAAKEYTGNFEPFRESKISSEIQGKIVSYYVDAGSMVKKGSPLVKIDNDLLKLQLQSVQVQINALEADVRRYKILVASDAVQGIQLEKAETALQSAIVQKRTIQDQISNSIIYAPFSGVITQKLSEAGSFAAPGVPLLVLTDINLLKFTVNVPESDLPLFQPKQHYKIVSDIYPRELISGYVSLVGSKGNNANLFPIQFTVTNSPGLKIKAGMFGRVEQFNELSTAGILIPASAITGSELDPRVYVIENNKAILKNIVIARRIGNKIMVDSGLKPGEIVITGGFINLFNNAPVKVK